MRLTERASLSLFSTLTALLIVRREKLRFGGNCKNDERRVILLSRLLAIENRARRESLPAKQMVNEDNNQSQSAAEIQTKIPFAHARAPGRSNSALVDHHSLLSEFGNRFARFAEAFATHALQYCLGFCKLDIRVLHDLHAVSPGISELHPSPR